MWEHITIPTYLVWKILVLVHKGSADTRGIWLMKALWKVMEAIIDIRINKAVTFHDDLTNSTDRKSVEFVRYTT